jgi:hypothetical protein
MIGRSPGARTFHGTLSAGNLSPGRLFLATALAAAAFMVTLLDVALWPIAVPLGLLGIGLVIGRPALRPAATRPVPRAGAETEESPEERATQSAEPPVGAGLAPALVVLIVLVVLLLGVTALIFYAQSVFSSGMG